MSSSQQVEISPKDQELIAELRKRVEKELCLCPLFDNDVCLLRWLIGWDRKLDVIVPKLKFSIRTCHALGFHKFDIKTPEDLYKSHSIYQSEVIKHMPGYVIEFDKMGHPIFQTALDNCDFGEILKCMKFSDLYIFNLVNTYGMLDMITNKESETGRKLGNVCICDLEGISLSQFVTMTKSGSVPKMTQVYHKIRKKIIKDMFPDLMTKIYIINTPSFLHLLTKMMMTVLVEETRKKIVILGHDYQDILRNELGADVLHEKYGGTRKNEIEVLKMGIGRRIPKEIYDKSNDLDPEKLQMLHISAGKTEAVPMTLEGHVPGRKLYWWWRLDSGNILFSVTKKEDGDEDHLCWPRFDLHTDHVPEWNEIDAEEPGEYNFNFENDGYLWSKTLRYFIEVRQGEK